MTEGTYIIDERFKRSLSKFIKLIMLMFMMYMFFTIMIEMMKMFIELLKGKPKPEYDKVWNFDKVEELNDFANKQLEYASVENSYLVFNPPSGSNGIASREEAKVYSKVKIRVKCLVSTSDISTRLLGVTTDDGGVKLGVNISTVEGDTSKLELWELGGNSATFTNPNDFFDLIVDFQYRRAYVYHEGIKLAEIIITEQPSSGTTTSTIEFIEYNQSTVVTDDYIDYVMVRYRG